MQLPRLLHVAVTHVEMEAPVLLLLLLVLALVLNVNVYMTELDGTLESTVKEVGSSKLCVIDKVLDPSDSNQSVKEIRYKWTYNSAGLGMFLLFQTLLQLFEAWRHCMALKQVGLISL